MSTVQSPPDARAWRGATLDPKDNWYYYLSTPTLSVIEEVLGRLRERPRLIAEIRPSAGQLAVLRDGLSPVLRALETGRGFVIVRGVERGRHSDAELTAAYWLVGQALGRPFEQNVQGTVLYDVRDTGQKVSEGVRFSVTNADSSFHTDNSFGETVLDYVGLLCLKTARSGGVNQVVSSHTALEELRREHPRACELLSMPFHVDRRGGVKEGQGPTAWMPVFEWDRGELLSRYLRYWIEAGHEKAGEPLTAEQVEALDTLDRVLARPDLQAEFSLEPGDMFWINNRWIFHSRTAFEDYPELERRRHLVRLWIRREE